MLIMICKLTEDVHMIWKKMHLPLAILTDEDLWSDWKKVHRWPVTRPDSDSDMTRARTWLGEWIHSCTEFDFWNCG